MLLLLQFAFYARIALVPRLAFVKARRLQTGEANLSNGHVLLTDVSSATTLDGRKRRGVCGVAQKTKLALMRRWSLSRRDSGATPAPDQYEAQTS